MAGDGGQGCPPVHEWIILRLQPKGEVAISIRIRGVLLWLGLVALAGCSGHAPRVADPGAPAQPTVILISIDGFRADYLDRGVSPNLAALAAQGVRARWMTPSFPTLTFPNHYTLVTGLYPDHHGIVNNTMDDPSIQPDDHFKRTDRAAVSDGRWWDEATPLWVSVQRQGGRAATMFWPGSEAAIHGVRPDYWFPFDAKMKASERVDHVLDWLDLPAAQRPRFITLYFNAVDTAGHEYGPDTPQVDAAIRHVDAAIGRLAAGLKQRGVFASTNIVVVSDHGFAPVAPGHEAYLDDVTDMGALRVVTAQAVAGLAPRRHVAAARLSRAEAKLLAPHPHMQCWKKQDIPARFHYGHNPRIPPIVCLAQTGWLIMTHDWQARHPRVLKGEHGYDNADPLMRALFIAEGPSFERGVVAPPFPNVDVYPLLTHILGIEPAPNDGDYSQVSGLLIAARR